MKVMMEMMLRLMIDEVVMSSTEREMDRFWGFASLR